MSRWKQRGMNAVEKIRTAEGRAEQALRKATKNPFVQEFKEFAVHGNVIDLAIGIMIGGGFNKLVTSLVNDIIMPPIGLVVGKVNFADLYFNLSGGEYATLAAAKEAGAVTINYGTFLNTVLDFLILAFVVFLLVRQINRLRRQEDTPPTTKKCPFCLSTIPVAATRCSACTSMLEQPTAL